MKNHALQQQAVMLAKRLDSFEAEALDFLVEEMKRPALRKFEKEISALVVQRVSLLWSESPGDGVVHFGSEGAQYSWVCRLQSGQLVAGSLGFDT